MKYKTIKVTFGATIGTGNYTNVRPEVTYEVELDENDIATEAELTQGLLYEARCQVAKTLWIPLAAKVKENLRWLSTYSDDDALMTQLKTFEEFAWLSEHEPRTTENFFLEARRECLLYRIAHENDELPQPAATPDVSDIPF